MDVNMIFSQKTKTQIKPRFFAILKVVLLGFMRWVLLTIYWRFWCQKRFIINRWLDGSYLDKKDLF